MTAQKNADMDNLSKLNKKQQRAIKLLFEDELTIKEISKELNCSERAIYKWKKDPIFIAAQREYALQKLDRALPDSVRELIKLVKKGKSEMVKLQAIQTVMKRAGLFSDNGTPELDKARIRKTNADARVAEAKAKAMEDNGQDIELMLDKMMDTLAKEDLKNGSK